MNLHAFGIALVWAAVGGVCWAAPAAAQPASPGPYGDLFGGTAKSGPQFFEIRGSVFGGYDDNLLAQGPTSPGLNVLDPRLQVPGMTGGLMSTAIYGYTHKGQGRSAPQFNFNGSASLQEYTGADSKALWVHNYGADVGFTNKLTKRISFSANGTASYGPYFQYLPFLTGVGASGGSPAENGASTPGADTGTPVEAPTAPIQTPVNISPVGTDTGIATQSEFVAHLVGGASISDRITRRSTLSANVLWDDTQVVGLTRIEARIARATFSHRLTRKLGLHAGFGVQDARYLQGSVASNTTTSQLLDVGLDYGDGLTIGRHYTLAFSTGTSAIRQANVTQYRLDGNATLARSIGRTWSASIGANRGTYYILGFGNPIFSDSLNAGVGGQLAQRLHFSAGATYLRGQNAFSAASDSLVTKNASTRLTLALTPHLGLYAQGSYYQYDVPDGFFSTLAFPQHLHRRAASVGLSFWVPMIKQLSERQP